MSKAVQVRALAAALAVALPSALHAAPYPDRAVKVILPFPPGGVTDIAARVITQKLSERLGQQFYIENIGGAGGISEWQMPRARAATATPSCSPHRASW
jgi:tripartite-type tricarboxylate transporter receptor subunit TctC